MEDIEDIVGPTDGNLPRISAGVITPKQLKPQTEKPQQSESGQFLPGQATVFVKTWGCGHNNSDGEYMAGMLATDGYNVILEHDRADEADIWVLNSCTVKGPSQTTFENDIKKGLEKGIKVVVAGCVPQGNQLGKNWQGLSVIGVQQIDKVVHVVEETLKGNQVRLFKESKTKDEDGKKIKSGGASLNLPKIRRNPFIEIIPINTGCLNQCTYCKTKHARGDLGSYQPEEIIERVKDVLDEGVLEIWLTSEDTGAYGRDIGKNIVDLLWGIVKVMEVHPSKNAMLRVGMTNPPYILEHLDGIAAVLSHPRVYSFLHVPVQAGATEVLNDMKRLYVIEDFEKVCDVLLAKVPEMTLATDVICGFPTETEEHFEETMRILQKYRFTVLHISQFYPRPGTPAARMKRVDTLVVKERSRKATKYFNSYTSFDHLVGEIQQVLITEVSSDGKHYVGHNKNYTQILIEKDDQLMGQSVKVEIVKASKWHLVGKVTEESWEELRNGVVSVNRIPQLIRIKKQMVAFRNDDTQVDLWNFSNEGHAIQRDDGAMLSTGKKVEGGAEVKQKANVRENEKIYSFATGVVKYGPLALAVPIFFMPVRNTIKLTVVVTCAIIYQAFKNK